MFKKLFGLGGNGANDAKKAPAARIERKGSKPTGGVAPRNVPAVPPMPDFTAPASEPMSAEPQPSQREVQALLRDALADAERELDNRKERDRRDPAGADKRQDRQALITAAMAVRRMKQGVLNDLDPQTRAKLKHFAESTMGVDKLPKKPS